MIQDKITVTKISDCDEKASEEKSLEFIDDKTLEAQYPDKERDVGDRTPGLNMMACTFRVKCTRKFDVNVEYAGVNSGIGRRRANAIARAHEAETGHSTGIINASCEHVSD